MSYSLQFQQTSSWPQHQAVGLSHFTTSCCIRVAVFSYGLGTVLKSTASWMELDKIFMNQFSKVGVVADHAGYDGAVVVLEVLESLGVVHKYFGTQDKASSVDYPQVLEPLGVAMLSGDVDAGVAVCGSGIGMSIAANKYKGVRAASLWSVEVAELARKHNDLNMLCLGGRVLEATSIREIVKVWISTQFEGGRHHKRVSQIHQIESESFRSGI